VNDLRSLSRAGLVVALALVMPPAFHAVQLGPVFLPLYLPVLVGAFLLPLRWAVVAAVAAPLLSALLTGMPPFQPPIALWMVAELGAMAALAGPLRRRLGVPVVASLAVALALGRGVFAALVAVTALWMDVPPGLLTLASLVAVWPGVALALVAVPLAVAAVERRTGGAPGARGR
jgi:hypothetical protein